VRIVVVGAGQIGRTVIERLHGEHELTVVDLDAARLNALTYRYDVRTVQGNGASRRVLQEAGVPEADLVIATTARDEANLVAAMLVKRMSGARTIVRATNAEYLDAWREREIDVNFMVSAELETANAVARVVGLPAARMTDSFADGQVQIVEFDVPREANRVVRRPLRSAGLPRDSKVAAVVRAERMVLPRGDTTLEPGDRILVIASPAAAHEWARLLTSRDRPLESVAIFGAGAVGSAVAQVLLDRGVRVRLIEIDPERARAVAEALPAADVFESTGLEPEFLDRMRIDQSAAAVFCMHDDAKNLHAAILAKLHGVSLAIGVIDDPVSAAILERGGVDVTINLRDVAAEEMIRFAHDPRVRQIATVGTDFEVLDITVRGDSELANRPLHELADTSSLVGAIIRNGAATFPHRDDVLRPGDRAIVFVESRRASIVERAL
jgi:trk system potassium uptake protein TrkA